MKRRDAIKTLMVASGGIFAFPAWAMNWKRDTVPEYTSTFNNLEFKLLSSLTDTIIPSKGEIGALSVGVDEFLAGLISECYEDDFQLEIKRNLVSLDASAQKKFGTSFDECSQAQREELFLAMNNKENENEEAFFTFMKTQIIRGFETSEEVMVTYHKYVMMPGFYDGNVDVEV